MHVTWICIATLHTLAKMTGMDVTRRVCTAAGIGIDTIDVRRVGCRGVPLWSTGFVVGTGRYLRVVGDWLTGYHSGSVLHVFIPNIFAEMSLTTEQMLLLYLLIRRRRRMVRTFYFYNYNIPEICLLRLPFLQSEYYFNSSFQKQM